MKNYHKNKETANNTTEKLRVTKMPPRKSELLFIFFTYQDRNMTENHLFPFEERPVYPIVPAAEKQRTSHCFSLQFEVPALNVDVSFSSIFCQKNHTEGGSANTSKRNQSMKCYSQPSACRLLCLFTWRRAEIIWYILFYKVQLLSRVPEIELHTSQQQRKIKIGKIMSMFFIII